MDSGTRHGVTDGPDGGVWVVVPEARDGARQLRAAHRFFWCSTWAGGCGGRLTLAVGEQNRPHFRHLPGEAVACPFATNWDAVERSYLHRILQDILIDWLSRQGLSGQLEVCLPDGARADLYVRVAELHQTIEVQLSPIPVDLWKSRTARYERHVDRVQWLYGAMVSHKVRAEDFNNCGLELSVSLVEGVRHGPPDVSGVQLTVRGRQGTSVAPLTDYRMTVNGIWNNHIAAAAEAQRQWLAERERARRRSSLPLTGLIPTKSRERRSPAPNTRVLPRGTGRCPYVAEDGQESAWEPPCGWGFLDDVNATMRGPVRAMSRLVARIEAGGPDWTLSFPNVDDQLAIQVALERAGLIELYQTMTGQQRWRRPGH